eukprot:scaffold1736_cov127-Cylindrotheca_fusiformis.AAC.109
MLLDKAQYNMPKGGSMDCRQLQRLVHRPVRKAIVRQEVGASKITWEEADCVGRVNLSTYKLYG